MLVRFERENGFLVEPGWTPRAQKKRMAHPADALSGFFLGRMALCRPKCVSIRQLRGLDIFISLLWASSSFA